MHDLITLKSAANTTKAGILAAISLWSAGESRAGEAKSPPAPKIFFQGKNVTNPSKPIVVAAGQQITLSADRQGTTQSWAISPLALTYASFAAYAEPPQCPNFPDPPVDPCVVYGATTLSNPETTFYVANSGTYDITYTYTKANGGGASSSTTFEAIAPTSVSANPKAGKVEILPQSGCLHACRLGLGNRDDLDHDPGILIKALAKEPKKFPGDFRWSQQIGVSIVFIKSGHVYVCPLENGLDAKFPSEFGDTFRDAPNLILDNDPELASASEAFSGVTTLLWQARKSDYVRESTPVALGIASWQWSGTAIFDKKRGWRIGTSSVATPQFFTYPESQELVSWYDVIPDKYVPDCPAQ